MQKTCESLLTGWSGGNRQRAQRTKLSKDVPEPVDNKHSVVKEEIESKLEEVTRRPEESRGKWLKWRRSRRVLYRDVVIDAHAVPVSRL